MILPNFINYDDSVSGAATDPGMACAGRRENVSMVNDGPNCLAGPVSRTSPWWTTSAAGSVRDKHADRPIRRELVQRVRREIAEGTYDTPEKWEAALDRLFRQLDQE